MTSLDRVFDILSDQRRRYALYYLERQDEPVSVDEVAEQVAKWESDSASQSLPEDAYHGIKMKLHHTDLPRASESSHIQYNPEEDTVEVVGEPPEFDAIITVAEIIERPTRNP